VTFERITIDPEVMGGVPGIRGLRIPATVIQDNLPAVAGDLAAGAVVVLADERIRIRRLPLLPG
jgi:hypothetical protein